MMSFLEYGLPDLVKTKSIERVVAPAVTHLCHLVLICETDAASKQFTTLEGAAEGVASSSKNMADVAFKLASESHDDVMKAEMEQAVAAMKMSGQHVLLAAQKLCIQPHLVSHRDELISSTQNVLLGLLKILLVEDDAAVRKIVTSAHVVLDCLSQLEEATDIASLLRAFQGFSEALLWLKHLAEWRAQDLRDTRQQEHLLQSLDTLKRCVSMLHTALCTTIKLPLSDQAQAAKKYIVDLVRSTTMELISTLTSSCQGSLSCPTRNYTDKLHVLLGLLSISECSSIRESNFHSLLGDLVIHCMVVANTSRKSIQSTVISCCRCILRLWWEISKWTKLSLSAYNTKQTQEELKDSCSSLVQHLLKLNNSVVTAILYQVLDVFVTARDPFDELLNTSIMSPENLQPQLVAFLSRADRMVQVASFTSGLSTDLKCIETIESSKACLMRLKGVAVHVLQELRKGSPYSGVMERLQSLNQRWAEETCHMTDFFNNILDVKALASFTLQEIEEHYSCCITAINAQSHSCISEHSSKVMSHMNHMVTFVKRHVNHSNNPIFRNGLLVLLNQVEAAMAELAIYVELVQSKAEWDMKSVSGFSQTFTKAVEQFHILKEGLDGLQHPDLLSPLRDNARQSSLPRPVLVVEMPKPDCSLNLVVGPEFSALGTDKTSIPSLFSAEHVGKDSDEPSSLSSCDTRALEAFTSEPEPTEMLQDVDLLPLVYEVLKATKEKDVTSLNMACTKVLELSNSYIQAAKEAKYIISDIEGKRLEELRLEVVGHTSMLVQAAQETTMGTAVSALNIFKHATLFSDGIRKMRHIVLPAAGTWYHAVSAMFQGGSRMANNPGWISEVMQLCLDVVQLVTTSIVVAVGDHHESVAMLHNKLKKAQTSSKHLAELDFPVSVAPDELDGPCILWALSVQVLLNSLDKILISMEYHRTEQTVWHFATPQKRMVEISESSLRIQEAARLTSLICKNCHAVSKMKGLQEEVKALTETYLQETDSLKSVPLSDITQLAKSELVQRQLLVKMKVLFDLISSYNREYSASIQEIICLAVLACRDDGSPENMKVAKEKFEEYTGSLIANVKATSEGIQDCLNYIRNPRVRANLRSTNEHLSSQVSDIVCRARKMVENQDLAGMHSLEIQTQYWSAEAHFLAEEIEMLEGVHQATKQQVRLCLQGRAADEGQNMHPQFLSNQEAAHSPDPGSISWEIKNPIETKATEQDTLLPLTPKQELIRIGTGFTASRGVSSLTYTSLCLKRETEKWDAQNNDIIQVTKAMAQKIYHMALYLRRKGPIELKLIHGDYADAEMACWCFTLRKEVFVSTAKDVVSSSGTVTKFVKVIADQSLNAQSKEDLYLVLERILTTTNQLTILSSVNALTSGSRSSDEILVKNAQNLLQIILQGVRAAETACIKGLRQPEPNSDAAEAAALCFQWRKNLQIHRAQQNSNLDTDDLGLRKTSMHPAAPSLAHHIHTQENLKWPP